ncbi:putative ABC transporter permease [Roseburia sp. 499]|uniref:putative ABC transporter permease n=1 Tax=Roseburia sp. 499 TaxID=1261634 RepID=UPI000951EC74|nr:putative ABC transporter permease [Roseburia sp. 499]WVK71309.1 putative ABC transporter permease [Roseburia sp. 499]
MLFSRYEIVWLFFVYSFLGWTMEVVHGVYGKRKLINHGLLNGIVCPVYGFSMVFLSVFLDSLREGWFYLFLGCMIVSSVIELITGVILEKVFQIRMWDYSNMKFQVGGYVCLKYAILWGILGMLLIKLANPFFLSIIHEIPQLVGEILLIVFNILLVVDTVTTLAGLYFGRENSKHMDEIADGFSQASNSLRKAITARVEQRMERAFPNQKKKDMESAAEKEEKKLRESVFAYGCGFHKIVWIFFLGAFLGDITETIFCWITTGELMSRSSVVYGPFSLVWGIGVAGITMLLYRYRNKEDRYIFLAGTFLGGAYEYICSVFTEICFGTVFWDYSDIPFNLGGRINLLFCFFWGIAALVWMKLFYPFFSKWIERIPMKIGKILSCVFVIFMTINIIISAGALARYSDRNQGIESKNAIEKWLDSHFDDSRMEWIYPNAKMTE